MWPSWNPRLLGESKCPFFPGVTLSYLMSYREFQDTFIISECVCVYMWVCNTYALCLIWRKNYGNVNFICFIHMYLYRENYSNFLDCWSLEDWLWENTCVCVYTYMCIYTHMHIHTYMYILHTYTHMYTRTYIYMCICICISRSHFLRLYVTKDSQDPWLDCNSSKASGLLLVALLGDHAASPPWCDSRRQVVAASVYG